MFLFKVEHTFIVEGQGLILTPGHGAKVDELLTGMKIKLIRPDKSALYTTVKGVAFNFRRDILISSEFTKENVPLGTEVWLIS